MIIILLFITIYYKKYVLLVQNLLLAEQLVNMDNGTI